MAKHEATVVLPSFGCALVTRIDFPESKAALSRIPARRAAYASLSAGVSNAMRANSLRRWQTLARSLVNAFPGK
ncbi:MAG: hypothetical protein ACREDV_00295 [Methylocella sp.]